MDIWDGLLDGLNIPHSRRRSPSWAVKCQINVTTCPAISDGIWQCRVEIPAGDAISRSRTVATTWGIVSSFVPAQHKQNIQPKPNQDDLIQNAPRDLQPYWSVVCVEYVVSSFIGWPVLDSWLLVGVNVWACRTRVPLLPWGHKFT